MMLKVRPENRNRRERVQAPERIASVPKSFARSSIQEILRNKSASVRIRAQNASCSVRRMISCCSSGVRFTK